jgi:hypothetical protein
VAEGRYGKWTLKTLVFDNEGTPGMTPVGGPTGTPTQEDIDYLIEALAELGEATGKALDEVQVPPSEFTVEGHIAIQVSAGLPPVVTFGVDTGISVSMTWNFEHTETKPLFGPRHG